jgi:Protein of unknown function (DUF1572)
VEFFILDSPWKSCRPAVNNLLQRRWPIKIFNKSTVLVTGEIKSLQGKGFAAGNYRRRQVASTISVIGAITPEQLTERHTIQGYDVCGIEAIYHVVEHFSMHTGQIIFITKLLTTEDLGYYRHLDTRAASDDVV